MLPEIHDTPDRDIPAAPWRLHGAACLSLWRVPVRLLPRPAKGIHYATVAGQALVVTAWINYLPGGTLAYDELAVAVVARGAGRFSPACTVSHIWVDDPVAAAGGRRLWAIPKQLATFDGQLSQSGAAMSATAAGSNLATLTWAGRLAMPGTLPLRGFIIQDSAEGPVRTRCAARGKVRLAKVSWSFSSSGPLAFLLGRKPLCSVQVADLQGSFGL